MSADPPVKAVCVDGCGWTGQRRLEVMESRPCPWCDGSVLAWQEPPLVFRAKRAVEARQAVPAVRQRFLCPPPKPDPAPDPDHVEPIRGFSHRIWIIDEGRYEVHTIPQHCRPNARQRLARARLR